MKRFSFSLAFATFALGMTLQVKPAHAIPIPVLDPTMIQNIITELKNYIKEQIEQNLQRVLNGESLQITGVKELVGKFVKLSTDGMKKRLSDFQDKLLGEPTPSKEEEAIGLSGETLFDATKMLRLVKKWGDKGTHGTEEERKKCFEASRAMRKRMSNEALAESYTGWHETVSGYNLEQAMDQANNANDLISSIGVWIVLEQMSFQEDAKRTAMYASRMAAEAASDLCSAY